MSLDILYCQVDENDRISRTTLSTRRVSLWGDFVYRVDACENVRLQITDSMVGNAPDPTKTNARN
jgi:hypothetical protein